MDRQAHRAGGEGSCRGDEDRCRAVEGGGLDQAVIARARGDVEAGAEGVKVRARAIADLVGGRARDRRHGARSDGEDDAVGRDRRPGDGRSGSGRDQRFQDRELHRGAIRRLRGEKRVRDRPGVRSVALERQKAIGDVDRDRCRGRKAADLVSPGRCDRDRVRRRAGAAFVHNQQPLADRESRRGRQRDCLGGRNRGVGDDPVRRKRGVGGPATAVRCAIAVAQPPAVEPSPTRSLL